MTGIVRRGYRAVDANMITPIELIKATVNRMAANGFGHVVNITSGAGNASSTFSGYPTVRLAG